MPTSTLTAWPAPGSGVLTTRIFPGAEGPYRPICETSSRASTKINRLNSNNAKLAMLPGKINTTSITQHREQLQSSLAYLRRQQQSRPAADGLFQEFSLVQLFDNLFSVNDQLWSFGYEHTGGRPIPGVTAAGARAIAIPRQYQRPLRLHGHSLSGAWYGYDSSVPGNFGTLHTSGNSKQLGVGADRVIFRDKDSITTFNSGLTYKETNNFLLGSKIEVGSRK